MAGNVVSIKGSPPDVEVDRIKDLAVGGQGWTLPCAYDAETGVLNTEYPIGAGNDSRTLFVRCVDLNFYDLDFRDWWIQVYD